LRQSSDGNLRPNRFDRVRPDYARIEIAVLHCLIVDVNLNIRESRRAKEIAKMLRDPVVPLVRTPPIE
jgi:hypothetical protein